MNKLKRLLFIVAIAGTTTSAFAQFDDSGIAAGFFDSSKDKDINFSEFHLPHPFNTDLYEFQKTAVKLVLRHLKKRGGAMLGDVVGLGKTITACAVAKYYEAVEGFSSLILLCTLANFESPLYLFNKTLFFF